MGKTEPEKENDSHGDGTHAWWLLVA